ncbi:hypothetical protein ACS0TY_028573 [Phlomoides rotata]
MVLSLRDLNLGFVFLSSPAWVEKALRREVSGSGRELNDLMETEGGNKKSSSSKSLFYEAPLGYSIEDVRPHGGIKKFRSAAYSNCVRQPS